MESVESKVEHLSEIHLAEISQQVTQPKTPSTQNLYVFQRFRLAHQTAMPPPDEINQPGAMRSSRYFIPITPSEVRTSLGSNSFKPMRFPLKRSFCADDEKRRWNKFGVGELTVMAKSCPSAYCLNGLATAFSTSIVQFPPQYEYMICPCLS